MGGIEQLLQTKSLHDCKSQGSPFQRSSSVFSSCATLLICGGQNAVVFVVALALVVDQLKICFRCSLFHVMRLLLLLRLLCSAAAVGILLSRWNTFTQQRQSAHQAVHGHVDGHLLADQLDHF
eukprot:COSAG02_NODE_12830_length_1486_cov_1.292718_2_plen_123_part_00